jgi:hypothetical protein
MKKLLFFGSLTCDDCNKLKSEFELSGIKRKFNYNFIDAMSDDTQDFCDQENVDELPHIKIYDELNNLILDRIKEEISLKEILSKAK